MQHADRLANADLKRDVVARNDTATAIELFEREKDFVGRDIATKIRVDSEEHIDDLETQFGLAQKLGEPNYLQSAAGEVKTSRAVDAPPSRRARICRSPRALHILTITYGDSPGCS